MNHPLMSAGSNRAAFRWVEKGNEPVPTPSLDYRAGQCLQCPHVQLAGGRVSSCKVCGCAGVKLFIPGAKCPDKPPRWAAVSACKNQPHQGHSQRL